MAEKGGKRESSWMEDLRTFLRDQEDVQAIRISPESHTVSVATFGKGELDEVESALRELLNGVERQMKARSGIESSFPAEGLWLRTESDQTVLEKTQCPAVRSLWTWKEYDWPSEDEGDETEEEWKLLAVLAGACGVFLIAAFGLGFVETTPSWLIYLLYGLAIVAGGWDAAVDTFENLKRGQVDIHFLMLAVALGALSIGSWAEGALLLFLFSLSGALEDFAEHRTHREIDSLTKSAPKTATVIDEDGEPSIKSVESVEPGMTIAVKPDELFPVDGEVVSGKTASDESNLTGEATPVEKLKGDIVYSGTLNLWGAVQVRVLRKATESSLQKIVRLIQDAQHLKAPSQRFTDKFGTGYTYLILGITLAFFLFSWLVLDFPPFKNAEGSLSAFYRAMTFLVVASPCALVLSIPSAILAAIAWGARKGILFRGGAAIEKLAEVDVVAMDKTGTLTQGELAVRDLESFPAGKEEEVLQRAYSLEMQSNHPIARAIVSHGKKKGLKAIPVEEFQSVSGRGLRGQVEDESIFLGRRELMADGPLAEWIENVEEPPPSVTEVWVFQKDLIGRILLEDKIREHSGDTLKQLKALGLKTLMLTGDRRSAAEAVGQEIGVQEVRSGLMPEDKVQIITELTEAGNKVAMVGDGVNDAPSLAAAYVAVSMGARGSDAALEQSEVVLMNDKIEKFLTAFQLSCKAKRIIKQNLVISLGTVVLMAAAALFGLIPLTIGVLAHEGSTVVVCLNSLRLLVSREQ
ncbi:MAG: cation-translocating P-type ATPase [Opitutales bacterium]|nr:cation-translocating P-type ATPase [Opitutales bacterium]